MLTHLYLLSFESKVCKEKEVDVNNVIKTPEPRQSSGSVLRPHLVVKWCKYIILLVFSKIQKKLDVFKKPKRVQCPACFRMKLNYI